MPKATLILPSAGCGLPPSCATSRSSVEHALVAAAQHGERAVRRQLLDLLAEARNSRRTWRLPRPCALRTLEASTPSVHSHSRKVPTTVGVLADALDQDVARALERGLGVCDALCRHRRTWRPRLGIERRVVQQRLGQRLQPGFARDLRLGAPLRLEGRIEVFQLDLGRRAVDGAVELRRQLALLARWSSAPLRGDPPARAGSRAAPRACAAGCRRARPSSPCDSGR